MSDTCTCGHVLDEHLARGEDKKHPNSSACTIKDCDCICFEEGEDDEESEG